MQLVNIIEPFFNEDEFNILINHFERWKFNATQQPERTFFENRLLGYPCYESKPLEKGMFCFDVFVKTFEQKTNLKIKTIKIFFRKVFLNELKKSPYKNRNESTIHTDSFTDNIHLAGVIYMNNTSLDNGTKIYKDLLSMEPTIIVGANPNRCVFYEPNVVHSASIDWRIEVRKTIVFFIELDNYDTRSK